MTRFPRRAPAVLLCAGALLLLLAPAALASAFTQVFADYKPDRAIDPCRHSPATLRAAQGQIPPDIDQYAPDFADQLAGALEAAARGDCDRKPKERDEDEQDGEDAAGASPGADDSGADDSGADDSGAGDAGSSSAVGRRRRDGAEAPPAPRVPKAEARAGALPPAPRATPTADGGAEPPWILWVLGGLAVAALLAGGATAAGRWGSGPGRGLRPWRRLGPGDTPPA